MFKIRKSGPVDGRRLVEIRRQAVDATHDFLDPVDRTAIDVEVQAFLPDSEAWLAADAQDVGIGFMGASGEVVDSLFMDANFRGMGAGGQLIEFALASSQVLTSEANEQNDQAVGFYQHMGSGRSAARQPTSAAGRIPCFTLRLDRSSPEMRSPRRMSALASKGPRKPTARLVAANLRNRLEALNDASQMPGAERKPSSQFDQTHSTGSRPFNDCRASQGSNACRSSTYK